MRLANVDPLRLDLVVVHQVLVTLAKIPLRREIVDRGAQAVAAMPPRHAVQLPQGLLESAAQCLERFGEADHGELPIRVGEREVIQQVVERLAVDRDAQRVHVGEVRCPQPARVMHLRKDDLLVGAMQPTPVPHPPLECPPLRVREPAGIALLQPGEQSERPQSRLPLESGLNLRPDLKERVRPCSPIARSGVLRRQSPGIPILPSRFLIHASSPCRQGQTITAFQQPPQLPHESIREHRNLHVNRKLRLLPHRPRTGIPIVAPPPSPAVRTGKIVVAEREK